MGRREAKGLQYHIDASWGSVCQDLGFDLEARGRTLPPAISEEEYYRRLIKALDRRIARERHRKSGVATN